MVHRWTRTSYRINFNKFKWILKVFLLIRNIQCVVPSASWFQLYSMALLGWFNISALVWLVLLVSFRDFGCLLGTTSCCARGFATSWSGFDATVRCWWWFCFSWVCFTSVQLCLWYACVVPTTDLSILRIFDHLVVWFMHGLSHTLRNPKNPYELVHMKSKTHLMCLWHLHIKNWHTKLTKNTNILTALISNLNQTHLRSVFGFWNENHQNWTQTEMSFSVLSAVFG